MPSHCQEHERRGVISSVLDDSLSLSGANMGGRQGEGTKQLTGSLERVRKVIVCGREEDKHVVKK